jgi:hypothetical protein
MKHRLQLGAIVGENGVRFQAARPAKTLKAASRRLNSTIPAPSAAH